MHDDCASLYILIRIRKEHSIASVTFATIIYRDRFVDYHILLHTLNLSDLDRKTNYRMQTKLCVRFDSPIEWLDCQCEWLKSYVQCSNRNLGNFVYICLGSRRLFAVRCVGFWLDCVLYLQIYFGLSPLKVKSFMVLDT